MRVYTFSEARQKFAYILKRAKAEGKVLVRRRDGSLFMIQPISDVDSPLDVKGVALGLSVEEIVGIVREGRRRRSR